jgi:transcriptional regulator of acetoin/glycerol metabolism
VLASWQYCLKLGIDPLKPPVPPVLKKAALNKLRNQYQELMQIAKPVMEMLEIAVKGTSFIITLAEKQGYVLEVLGDRDIIAMAQRNYYEPGCLRSTEKAGTNGIGLCIELERAIQLTGPEHYNINHHLWTCSSSPIFEDNKPIGAITLSGKHSEKHQHTLALVTAAAKNVESQLRERKLVEATQRLNHLLSTTYDSVSDGFIAIDQDRRVTHLNKAAAHHLQMKADEMVGEKIDRFIESSDEFLEALSSGIQQEIDEIPFRCHDRVKTLMGRVGPIYSPTFKLLGSIISITEQKNVLSIAKKIGGNYAKYDFSDIIGKAPQFLKQIDLAKLAATTNSRVLLVGESGTGKELFAHAIHNHSMHCRGPFVAISCAAIPRDLIESELFGYKGGAFTGARSKGMIGKFELASGGTLFLDEVNGLPLEVQAKLLRVLQQNQIMRLGDTRTIDIDTRVVAASNTDLMEEVDNGHFREDLYYRLNVMEIFIPPLRERMDDIELLIDHITNRHCIRMNLPNSGFSHEAISKLKSYNWPGNVRELENFIDRALLLSQGQTIEPDHLTIRPRNVAARSMDELSTMAQGQKTMIKAALKRCNWNMSQAARQLNIARSTLYRKMEQFGIKPKK